jgi:hypothetical protein
VGPSFFDQFRPVDVEGEAQLPRRITFDHYAADMQRTIGLADDISTADSLIDFDRVAEKIFSAELRRCQCFPHPLWRRGDVDRIDDGGFEIAGVHDISQASSFSAAYGISSGCPVSRI